MLSKVLVQARIDHTVPIALSQKAIKENSTEDGNWLFDEQERKFLKKEIVKELEEEAKENYIHQNNKETMRSFLKRAMKKA